MPLSIRLVIAGGGTGGHVQPALAVLQSLRQKANVDPLWIGSRGGVEASLARENNAPFRAIQTGKLRRYFSLQTPIDAMRIPLGSVQAFNILRRFRPDVIFSTGGFVSVPTVVAGRLLRIPSITHEQTATVGLATKINARFATVVALSFAQSQSQMSGTNARLIVTGNPVRASLFGGSADAGREHFSLPSDLPLIYVTGGALGAQAINRTVMDALPQLLQRAVVLHQCGPASGNGDLPLLEAARNTLPFEFQSRYAIRERIGEELADVYAAAALVVGRAGAGTVAELAALGKPALLVPLPGTGGDEQTLNARFLEDAGAAVLLPQDQLTPDRLMMEIDRLLDSSTLETMSEAARRIGRTDAADRLANAILQLALD